VPATRRVARPRVAALLAGFVLGVLLWLPGCSARSAEPVRDSREALGTFVTVTAYGPDRAAIQRAIDDAFDAIAGVEAQLSAYPDIAADPTSASAAPAQEATTVAQFNLAPYQWHVLPGGAVTVLDRVRELGVEDYFAPGMLRVVQLYDFEGGGNVPDSAELTRMVRAAQAFETRVVSAGVEGRFAATDVLLAPPNPAWSSFAPPAAGLDLSAALKGLALDAALAAMEDAASSGDITGALVSAGSTTLVTGRKASAGDAGPWRVGIEDPRDPKKIIGVVDYSLPSAAQGAGGEAGAFGTVSTSGDYQQSFVRDGVRYHHILEPAAGTPARGMRSLTVVGASSGLDSDILSTALFVMGVEKAETYARNHGLGLFIVDAEGRTRIVPGPKDAPWEIREGSG